MEPYNIGYPELDMFERNNIVEIQAFLERPDIGYNRLLLLGNGIPEISFFTFRPLTYIISRTIGETRLHFLKLHEIYNDENLIDGLYQFIYNKHWDETIKECFDLLISHFTLQTIQKINALPSDHHSGYKGHPLVGIVGNNKYYICSKLLQLGVLPNIGGSGAARSDDQRRQSLIGEPRVAGLEGRSLVSIAHEAKYYKLIDLLTSYGADTTLDPEFMDACSRGQSKLEIKKILRIQRILNFDIIGIILEFLEYEWNK